MLYLCRSGSVAFESDSQKMNLNQMDLFEYSLIAVYIPSFAIHLIMLITQKYKKKFKSDCCTTTRYLEQHVYLTLIKAKIELVCLVSLLLLTLTKTEES